MSEGKISKGKNIGLWVVQVLVGLGNLMAGFMKFSTPIEEMQANPMMNWTNHVPEFLIYFSSVAEILIGLGLLLPMMLNVMPKLTRYAGLGLVGLQTGAIILHFSIGEYMVVVNVVYLLLGLLVFMGRKHLQ